MASIPKPVDPVPPKPVSEIWRPELTRLPQLSAPRRMFRRAARGVARLLLAALTRTRVSGLERVPPGPVLFATNHLGDTDAVVLLATFRVGPEVLAKIEMRDFPVVGKLMDWYGMIWLHRGQPDRRAVRAALQALRSGRALVIAPEGRYTLARGLEPASNGAAYIAAQAGVPVVPVALTGTANPDVYGALRRLRRPPVTVTFGEPVELPPYNRQRDMLQENTERIMRALAALLPAEYRGVYR